MLEARAILLATLMIPLSAAAAAGDTSTETRPYVAGGVRTCNVVDAPWLVGGSQGVSVPGTSPAYDVPLTACFQLDGDEQTVSIEVTDDLAETVMVLYVFQTPDPFVSPRGYFCDAVEDLSVPAASVRLEVFVSEQHDERCAPLGPGGTTGIVSVAFHDA